MTEDEIKQRIEYKLSKIHKYLETGELNSSLSRLACLVMSNVKHGWKRTIPAIAKFEQQWVHVFERVSTELEDIELKMKEFELKHWMGFCDEDVSELLKLRRQWNHFDWENATIEEGNTMRDLWNPSPNSIGTGDESYWRDSWQKYIDRRDKVPLQESFDGRFCSNDDNPMVVLARASAGLELPKLKMMMGASSGRVLITLRDQFSQGDPESIYGGAWLTMIFDQDSGWPHGGLQGQCATRDEGVGMIQSVIDNMPVLAPDNQLSIS